MSPDEFQKKCFRTERPAAIHLTVDQARALHGAIGAASEAGELLSNIKAAFYYGKEIDKVNVLEECGDVLWFISVLLDSCGYTMSQAMTMNVAKLASRFPDGFSESKATDRNLSVERKILEKK